MPPQQCQSRHPGRTTQGVIVDDTSHTADMAREQALSDRDQCGLIVLSRPDPISVASVAGESNLDYGELPCLLFAHNAAHAFSHVEVTLARHSLGELGMSPGEHEDWPRARLSGNELGRVVLRLFSTCALPGIRRFIGHLAHRCHRSVPTLGWRPREVIGHIRWTQSTELTSLHATLICLTYCWCVFLHIFE